MKIEKESRRQSANGRAAVSLDTVDGPHTRHHLGSLNAGGEGTASPWQILCAGPALGCTLDRRLTPCGHFV